MRYLCKAGLSALLAALVLGLGACQGQRTYPTPEAALTALTAAVKQGDKGELRRIFGPQAEELKSGDPDQDRADMTVFSRRLEQAAKLQRNDDTTMTVLVGNEQWPFAVPLVKADNAWRFDTDSGLDELTNRRIGRNELRTIECCRTVIDAQAEFFARETEGKHFYADRLMSTPGKKDGLYWDSPGGVDPSPIGPVFAASASRKDENGKRIPFNGYLVKVLERQAAGAPGGAMEYRVDGRLVKGWAVVLYPAEYDVTGIMSFLVSNAGIIYQKDLGEDTQKMIDTMTAFDPSNGWTTVAP